MKELAIELFPAGVMEQFEQVARNNEPLLLTKEGRPLATLVPAKPQKQTGSILGRLEGTVTFHGDIVAPVVDADDWEVCR